MTFFRFCVTRAIDWRAYMFKIDTVLLVWEVYFVIVSGRMDSNRPVGRRPYLSSEWFTSMDAGICFKTFTQRKLGLQGQ
eukprot:2697814-Amphidinium_carterae.1